MDEIEDGYTVFSDAYDEISRTRVSLNILPNLKQLTWLTDSVDRMRLSLMFQHKNIKEFIVRLHRNETYSISTFFEEVLLRMPNLTLVDLRFTFPVREIEDDLSGLIRRLPRLRKIILPAYTLSTRIIEELSTLKGLEVAQFEFMEWQGHGEIADVARFNPQLSEGAFPALWDLSLSANLVDMDRFLRGSFSPSHLTTLYVHCLSAVTQAEFTGFLTAASEVCQLLEHLFLDFFTSEDIQPGPEDQSRLSWPALRPLLAFSNLIEFEMRWDRPLELSQEDMEEMASKWPSLETLLLNCEPMVLNQPPTLDLRALIPFARHCPKLTALGLYLSASTGFDEALRDPSLKPFKSLQKLYMGLSPISEPGPVALFLSQLCPVECELSSGTTWPNGFAMRDFMDQAAMIELDKAAAAWFEKWTEVGRTLPLLTQLRVEEREYRQSMEKELEDLRIRHKLLSTRAATAMRGDGTCIIS